MQFQSTRPRGARQIEGQSTVLYHVVSIHAPAWGATADAYAYELHINRFNPRARVGRDVTPAPTTSKPPAFQSTRPRGARLALSQSLLQACRVSIHAPAWGATASVYAALVPLRFQSTRPRGARPSCTVTADRWGHVSIHAPAWGATELIATTQLPVIVSIHAPAWGATSRHWSRPVARRSFNPRARVGRDHMTLNYEQIKIYCTIRANPSLTYRCTALSH